MSSPRGSVIRKMQFEDLPGVLETENASFEDPWSWNAWVLELNNAEAHCFVSLSPEGELIGYLAFRQVLDEGHVMKLAVPDVHRRKGIASSLLLHAMAALKSSGGKKMFLELRQSNTAAAGFYRSMGFRTIGKRKGYYRTPSEDAVVMSCQL